VTNPTSGATRRRSARVAATGSRWRGPAGVRQPGDHAVAGGPGGVGVRHQPGRAGPQQGSGAFLAFLLAALLSGCVAVGWAELGALYPTAGAATPTGSCWTHPSVTETSATT